MKVRYMLFMLFVHVSISLYMYMTFPVWSSSKCWKNPRSLWCCPYTWSPMCLAAGGQGKTPATWWARLLVQPLVWLTTGAGMHLEVIDLASEGECWELHVLNQLLPLTSCQSPDHWRCKTIIHDYVRVYSFTMLALKATCFKASWH